MSLKKNSGCLLLSGVFFVCALSFSACTPVRDIYLAYDGKKTESELCLLSTVQGKPQRKDVAFGYGGEIIKVDGQTMKSSKLLRQGESEARYLTRSENPSYGGYKVTDDYIGFVQEARLLPGKHDFTVKIKSERLNIGVFLSPIPPNVYDEISITGWDCQAGRQYRFFYSKKPTLNRPSMQRVWIESSGNVLWEGWKPADSKEVRFNLSKRSTQ